jgi:tetratricopeptide (TPR) repeat protein
LSTLSFQPVCGWRSPAPNYVWILWFALLVGDPQPPVHAQALDTVVVRNSAGSTLQRRGKIIEWKGSTLLLEMKPIDKKIDNRDIVSFQTLWPAAFQEAQQHILSGRFELAVGKLAQAIKDETRPWAKRHIRAELVRVLAALNQWEAAIDQFLVIIAEDPESQFYYLCPLKWLGNAAIVTAKAEALLKSGDPLEQLLGASWSLAGRNQESAAKLLEQLTSDIDVRIQKLATTQLWRLRAMNLSSINDRQIAVWESKLAEMPEKFRAGPWHLIAELQMKQKQTDSAIINWLRIPILYPDQYSLSASALHQSSLLLDNLGRAYESLSLKNELKQRFPDTIWGKQIPTNPGGSK